jgi:hypothetical protein
LIEATLGGQAWEVAGDLLSDSLRPDALGTMWRGEHETGAPANQRG